MKGNSERDFIMLYALMAGLFFIFLLVLFLISGKVFEEAKTEDVKEGTKIVLRIISILMCLYIFILQMPLVTLTFQGFLCDEEASEILVLTAIKCDSLTHQLLVLSSTVILIVYGAFLIIEQVLYSSNSFEEVVPWGSFERVLATVRVMIKTVISIGFVFDKKGQYRGEVNLILFFLQTFIVVRRYQDCIIFNKLGQLSNIKCVAYLSFLRDHILRGLCYVALPHSVNPHPVRHPLDYIDLHPSDHHRAHLRRDHSLYLASEEE